MIPRIETERLVLVPPKCADFAALARLWNRPEVYRYIWQEARPDAQLWVSYLANVGAWAEMGYGMWSVKRRDTGELIGQVGFPCAKRGHGAGFDEYPEVGWLFGAAGQGQGFAHEAMAAALGWFDEAGLAERSVCMIYPENAPSMRLADKLGFVKTRMSPVNGDKMQLFERRL